MKTLPRNMLKLALFSGILGCLAAAIMSIGATADDDQSDQAVLPGFVFPAAGDSTDTILRIGDEFPPLQAVDFDGQPVTFDKRVLGPRYTLLVFWSTWCGFCMHELPHEVELSQKYEGAGLRVIGVNADEDVETAKEAAQAHGVPWLNVFEGSEKKISEALGIKQWPALLLLDSEGRVVATSPSLRAISVETDSDGTDRQINGLEWILRELLERKLTGPQSNSK
jgi:thiol-disulfide isomerase/thioredoxin